MFFIFPGLPFAHADNRRESDTPFKMEDFSPRRGGFSINAGMGYGVTDNKDLDLNLIAIPINHEAIFYQPLINLKNEKRHTVFSYLGIRYGLFRHLNLRFRLSGEASHSRIRENGISRQESDIRLQSMAGGFDYHFNILFDNPFVLGFFEINALEDSHGTMVYGKTASAGIASHWAHDPVILSLVGTYSHLFPRTGCDPGEVFNFAPSFGLAITPEISANIGMSQILRTADTINGQKGEWNSSSALTFGYSHRLSPILVMGVNVRCGIAGSDAVHVTTNFTWRF